MPINAKEVSCCNQKISQHIDNNQIENLDLTRLTEVHNYRNNKSNDAGSLIEQKPSN